MRVIGLTVGMVLVALFYLTNCDDNEPNWQALTPIIANIQKGRDRHIVEYVKNALKELIKWMPESETLYYIGYQVGEHNGVRIGKQKLTQERGSIMAKVNMWKTSGHEGIHLVTKNQRPLKGIIFLMTDKGQTISGFPKPNYINTKYSYPKGTVMLFSNEKSVRTIRSDKIEELGYDKENCVRLLRHWSRNKDCEDYDDIVIVYDANMFCPDLISESMDVTVVAVDESNVSTGAGENVGLVEITRFVLRMEGHRRHGRSTVEDDYMSFGGETASESGSSSFGSVKSFSYDIMDESEVDFTEGQREPIAAEETNNPFDTAMTIVTAESKIRIKKSKGLTDDHTHTVRDVKTGKTFLVKRLPAPKKGRK